VKISDAFPSRYLKASDLPHPVTVHIDQVKMEDVDGSGHPDNFKPCLYFRDKSKGMVLNKTNAFLLKSVLGNETEEWYGQTVSIYVDQTQYQGRMVPCLRLRIPEPQASP